MVAILGHPTCDGIAMFDDSDFPATPDDIDTTFLSRVLSCDVQSVVCQPLESDVGFTSGQLVRVCLTYQSSARSGPATAIAKCAPVDPDLRWRFSELNAREVKFYSGFAHCYAASVPKCYFARFHPGTASSLILLEDLGAAKSSGFLAGSTVPQVASVVDALASAHAVFWDQQESDGLSPSVSLSGFDLKAALAAYPERLADLLPDQHVPARFWDICTALTDAFAELEDATSASPRTLVHKDVHLDNIAFRSNGDAVFLDWQFADRGCGAHDLTYFLTSSLEPNTRRAMEASLLRRYHSALEQKGVTGYTIEACTQDYLSGIFAKIRMTVLATVCFDNATPDKIAWRAADLRRVIAFCEDHAIKPKLLRAPQRVGLALS